jgi:NAD(P)-dependent dehydrogenase (short-subunit alcohol dehydrogenase family)
MVNVVIGAASGMGIEVAKLLAPRGPLLLVDRDADGVERLAAELGTDVAAAECDITDPAQIDAVVGQIRDAGGLDALVVTAGLAGAMAPGRVIYEVNLRGMERVLRGVDPLVGAGTVGVLFASVSGHRIPERAELMAVIEDPLADDFFDALVAQGIDPDDAQLAYSVSKRGVMRLARGRAASWGARGARILSLSPGSTQTEMSMKQQAATPQQAQFIASSPLGRRGRPEEIAAVAAFLTSAAASFRTGSDVHGDGGIATMGAGG